MIRPETRFVRTSRALALAGFAAVSVLASPLAAKAVKRDDFILPENSQIEVVVFRPDVHVGSLKVGGLDEPNVEWTEAARTNLQAAIEKSPEFTGAKVTFIDEMAGDQAQLLNEYRGMFELVSGAMFTHVALGMNALPTKQKLVPPVAGDKFKTKPTKVTAIDWTLGDGTVKLKEATGADYALFIFTHDSYGDTGRKVAQLLMAGLFGAWVPAGVHIGYAGLVDLETGNVVWFNTDLEMGGDVREPDGAVKRADQLLRGFPTNPDPEEDEKTAGEEVKADK